jgi:hypothetical protein
MNHPRQMPLRLDGSRSALALAKFVTCYCSRYRKTSGSACTAKAHVSPEHFNRHTGRAALVRHRGGTNLCDVILRQVRIAATAPHRSG